MNGPRAKPLDKNGTPYRKSMLRFILKRSLTQGVSPKGREFVHRPSFPSLFDEPPKIQAGENNKGKMLLGSQFLSVPSSGTRRSKDLETTPAASPCRRRNGKGMPRIVCQNGIVYDVCSLHAEYLQRCRFRARRSPDPLRPSCACEAKPGCSCSSRTRSGACRGRVCPPERPGCGPARGEGERGGCRRALPETPFCPERSPTSGAPLLAPRAEIYCIASAKGTRASFCPSRKSIGS